MVTDAILSVLVDIIGPLIDTLPEWDPFVASDGGGVAGFLYDLNYFLPISELAGVVVGVFYVLPLMLGFSFGNWLLVGVLRGGSPRA